MNGASCPTSASRSRGAARAVAGAQLVLTTGGTVSRRATYARGDREVLDRDAPGIAQAIRADSISKTPHGSALRGLAGVAGWTLVVEPPGLTGRLP